MDGGIPTLKIFVSSPGDVTRERRKTEEVIERLDAEFGAKIRLIPYFWEHEPLNIAKDYQAHIPPPSGFDIFICILWSRLGTRLHSRYMLPPDYTRVARSGTEYEFQDAWLNYVEKGVPEMLVWVNKSPSPVTLGTPDYKERGLQYDELKAFIGEWTQDKREDVRKGAVNSYRTLVEFEELLEKKLRKVVENRPGGTGPVVRGRPRWPGNPYRGLGVFEYWHAPIYCGRTAAIEEVTKAVSDLLGAVGHQREGGEPKFLGESGEINSSNGSVVETKRPSAFALIFGASGSGKSSLIRAGVMPMLSEGKGIEGVSLWRCAVVKPSEGNGNLAFALASALVQPAQAAPTEEERRLSSLTRPAALPELLADGRKTIETIAKDLDNQPECAAHLVDTGLSVAVNLLREEERRRLHEEIETCRRESRLEDAELAKMRLAELKPRRPGLVLLLDQFEELFTGSYTKEAVSRFLCVIETLASSGLVVVLATLRSEFFKRCEEFEELIRLKRNGATVHLTAPRPNELAKMISQPAQKSGVEFEKTEEDGWLNERILKAASDDPDSLPLLEFCLDRLYEARSADGRIGHREYVKLGELSGVLNRRADKIFEGLSVEAQQALDAVISVITTVGKRRDEESLGQAALVRRVVRFEEIKEIVGAEELVDAFVAGRLFTTDQNSAGERVFSVTHETLLRRWERVEDWFNVDDNRSLIRVRSRVAERLNQWRDSARENSKDGALAEGDPSFLLQPPRELEDARQHLVRHRVAFSREEQDFIAISLEAAEEKIWRAVLAAGGEGQMQSHWQKLEIEYATMRDRVLAELLTGGTVSERRHAALLVGMVSAHTRVRELVRIVLGDEEETVRRAAAYSLMRLDDLGACQEIADLSRQSGEGTTARGALSRLLIAADMQVHSQRFDEWFRTLPVILQRRVRFQSWGLRLKMAVPVVLTVVTPAMLLATLSAMAFKWIPGLFNYAYGQAIPSAPMGIFHGAVAGVLIGGTSALGLVLYRNVIGREHTGSHYLSPMGALVAGALFGGLGGLLCDLAIAGVYLLEGLQVMGWISPDALEKPSLPKLFSDLFFGNLCGWVFVLNGAGVGIGMAMMTNRLRRLPRWEEFLQRQSATSLTSLHQTGQILRGLIRLFLPYAWPIPAVLVLTSLLGLGLLQMAGMRPSNLPWSAVFLRGMESARTVEQKLGDHPTEEQKLNLKRDEEHAKAEQYVKLREWKTSRGGRILGIAGDSSAKVIGAFFAAVGMGFGIVILRSGINVEPRKKMG